MSITTSSIAVRMLLGIAVTMPLSQSAAQEETLMPTELKTLGPTAGTALGHERIAEYYRAEAKRFEAKEQEYEQELADYYRNPFRSDLYGGTYRLFESVFQGKGIKARYVDLRDAERLDAALHEGAAAVWIESPTNPLMNLVDLAAVANAAHRRGALAICDNTFLSPYFQRPLEFGIDVVVHSTTKYINGHSDVVGGAVVVNREDLAERIGFLQNAMGTCAAPQDCFLVLRGIKTLALRMEEHNRNALAIAEWLSRHAAVERVLHPGLSCHPQHELARRQMRGYGGTFSFRLRGGEDAVLRTLGRVRVFTLAASLGGVESLIEHPATMTHASMPKEVREQMGITSDLIRVSVGLEDVTDLIADLTQALEGA